MKPTFIEGVVFAAAASVCGGVLFTGLAPFMLFATRASLVACGLSLAYVMYLLCRTDSHYGRLVTMTAWIAIAACGHWFAPTLTWLLLIHVGFIWIIRSLYFHDDLVAAVADLILSSISVAAGAWAALNTHSVFAIIWCVFLVHAAFVVIPILRSSASPNSITLDRFGEAKRAADAALRALARKV